MFIIQVTLVILKILGVLGISWFVVLIPIELELLMWATLISVLLILGNSKR